ncbi:MAG: AI-2E family transporter [Gammaproteobacteria bacterium HGW-Gammaproteobacteria-10]|nr:MAG: AI-2E family transporter [Gammaproteobacteria bacterium HGW-Gammaproteobacteria-10]
MNYFAANSPLRYLIPGILLAGLLLLGYWVLSGFLLSITWAFIIAYATWPAYRRLRTLLKDNGNLSASIMTGIIAMIIILAVFGLATLLQEEIKIAYQALAFNLLQGPYEIPEPIKRIPWLGNYFQEWLDRLISDRASLTAQITDWARQSLGYLGKIMGGIGHYIMKIGIVTVTLFFCFRDGEDVMEQLHKGLVQFLGKHQDIYLHAIANTTSAVVYGLVLTALSQGLLAGLGFYIADVQAPALFGAITALLALVPMVGAALVWVPIGTTLIFIDRVSDGIGVLLWGALVVSTIDNVVRPIIISGAGRVPFLVVFFGVLGGLASFGAVGLFLGPVILAVLLAVWRAWLEQQSEEPYISS